MSLVEHKRATAQRIRYQRIKKSGLCPSCEKKRPMNGKSLCFSCLAERRINYHLKNNIDRDSIPVV